MKHTKKTTVMENIPQEAQNTLLDRKERMGREKFEKNRTAENEAPRKALKGAIKKLGNMLGLTKKGEKKPTVKKSKGDSVSKRADGCATKGKTRGRVV